MTDTATLVKLGGRAASDPSLMTDLAVELAGTGARVAIVHGGGAEVSALSKRLGIEPVFSDGIRMTSPAEMDLVEMVLAGVANKRLVRLFGRAGVRAVGICGADAGLVTGTCVADHTGKVSRTATVKSVNPQLVGSLWDAGYTPIIGSTASDASGGAVNINADDVAFALAEALGVSALVFLSDVPGVLADGEVVARLSGRESAELIASGSVSGGMIPKVKNALTAVSRGVGCVVVGSYENRGDMGKLLTGDRGTRFEP